MKRRILLFASSGGAHGGVEAFVATLFHHLRCNPEFEVRVLLKVRRDCPIAPSLFDLFEHNVRPAIFRLNFLTLLAAVRWADLVHANYPSAYLGIICRLLGKPWVLTVHNWKRAKGGWMGWLEGVCQRGARRRWYNSRFVADTWEDRGALPGSGVVPTVSDLPDLWIAPEERSGFVFAARWVPGKGLEDLIEAYATAELDRIEHPLILLGDGLLRDEVHRLIRQFGASGIAMPGFVTEAVKKDRIAHARWLVAPSRTREDLGLTPIEARCCGVPAIVTRDGGLPEAAGEAGMVVRPGDIAGLREALQTAAAMPPEAYADRARLAKESLKAYLKPLSFYEEEYRLVLGSPRTVG